MNYMPCRSYKALNQLDNDFLGPIKPESIRNRRYGLLIICPRTKMLWAVPVRHKADNTEKVSAVLKRIRAQFANGLGDPVLYYFRTDNEPVWDGNFSRFLENNRILPLRLPPYSP